MTHLPPNVREFAVPTVLYVSCPIRASLGVLGRKWALLILRDVGVLKGVRFSDLLKHNEGLTPRMLTFRLKELQAEGLISRVSKSNATTYELSEKGQYAFPILTAFISYGIRYHAGTVFHDGKPRVMGELLPRSQREMLGPLLEYAHGVPAAKPSTLAGPARTSRSRGPARAVDPKPSKARTAKTQGRK